VLLLATAGSAQFTTITDGGQDSGPMQFALPNIRSGVSQEKQGKSGHNDLPIQYVPPTTSARPGTTSQQTKGNKDGPINDMHVLPTAPPATSARPGSTSQQTIGSNDGPNNDMPIQYVPPTTRARPGTSQPTRGKNEGPHKWVAPSEAPSASQQSNANDDPISALLGGSAEAQPTLRHSLVSVPTGPRASPSVAPMATTSRSRHHGVQDLSRDSMQVVRGLVEAFMHKVELMPGEKKCLETNIGTFAGDIMGTVDDLVTGIKALVKGKGTIAKGQGGGVMAAGMDGGMKLMSLVTLSTSVLKNCVHGDALKLLKKTGQHMINGKYLEHRILVNGVDVARSLSDAILAFEDHHFHRFGTDIGTALRKILLSKATGGSSLPEGVPEQVIIQKATEGLMDGFFVRGSSLKVTDTAVADVDIVVNLHQCIAGNSMFFKEIWMAAWDLFAQISVNKDQHGLGKLGLNQNKGQPKWQGELMVAMMQVPMALNKCGVSQQMQGMLMEAIKSLQGLNVDFRFPHHHVTGQETAERMAKAVDAWTRWDFEKFGYELGKLFRELVMLAFPQKYSIDASGKLWLSSQLRKPSSSKQTGTVFMTTIIGGAAALFAAALLVVRVRRLISQPQMESLVPLSDLEDLEVVE